MAKTRSRLDLLLVERELVESRQKGQALIMAGKVLVDGQVERSAGKRLAPDVDVEVRATVQYVSRGAKKLEGAWKDFSFPIEGRVVLDGGASTGGFTDFLLQHGARCVHAVDVGYGQLAWKLRQDPRVLVRERCNLRWLEGMSLDPVPDLAVLDLSFIGIMKVLPAVVAQLSPGGEIVSLIKPQFEAGPESVGKRGVVGDPAVHRRVLEERWRDCLAMDLAVLGATVSPIRGPKGNVEFFFHLAVPPLGGRAAVDLPLDELIARATALRSR